MKRTKVIGEFGIVFLLVLGFSACKNCNSEVSSTQKKLSKTRSLDTQIVGSILQPKPKPVADSVMNDTGVFYFISLKNKDSAVKAMAKQFFQALSPEQKTIVLKLNRVDATSYLRLDTFVVPKIIDTNWMELSIFPQELPFLKDVHKMLVFAYYQEAFGAYENGHLVRWGPTNMGKKATPTPTGLFFTNWKAKETVSTVNEEWILKWNFNISNYGGVGFHQYQLPGYPASHSCLRLLEADAMFLYAWANQWMVNKNGNLIAKGTPVLVYGFYPFGKSKPWWSLVKNKNALTISADTLSTLIKPHLEMILKTQKLRDSLEATFSITVPNNALQKKPNGN